MGLIIAFWQAFMYLFKNMVTKSRSDGLKEASVSIGF